MRGAKRGSPRRLGPERPAPVSKQCEEKRLYVTRAEASAHALTLPASARVGLEAYLCSQCGCFHLGHSKRRTP